MALTEPDVPHIEEENEWYWPEKIIAGIGIVLLIWFIGFVMGAGAITISIRF